MCPNERSINRHACPLTVLPARASGHSRGTGPWLRSDVSRRARSLSRGECAHEIKWMTCSSFVYNPTKRGKASFPKQMNLAQWNIKRARFESILPKRNFILTLAGRAGNGARASLGAGFSCAWAPARALEKKHIASERKIWRSIFLGAARTLIERRAARPSFWFSHFFSIFLFHETKRDEPVGISLFLESGLTSRKIKCFWKSGRTSRKILRIWLSCPRRAVSPFLF